jgi:hypothetical protein
MLKISYSDHPAITRTKSNLEKGYANGEELSLIDHLEITK